MFQFQLTFGEVPYSWLVLLIIVSTTTISSQLISQLQALSFETDRTKHRSVKSGSPFGFLHRHSDTASSNAMLHRQYVAEKTATYIGQIFQWVGCYFTQQERRKLQIVPRTKKHVSTVHMTKKRYVSLTSTNWEKQLLLLYLNTFRTKGWGDACGVGKSMTDTERIGFILYMYDFQFSVIHATFSCP